MFDSRLSLLDLNTGSGVNNDSASISLKAKLLLGSAVLSMLCACSSKPSSEATDNNTTVSDIDRTEESKNKLLAKGFSEIKFYRNAFFEKTHAYLLVTGTLDSNHNSAKLTDDEARTLLFDKLKYVKGTETITPCCVLQGGGYLYMVHPSEETENILKKGNFQ